MEKKKAFVFDTNFIIQNRNLDDVLSQLSEHFSVYITQVSIDERIAQQCRMLRKDFDGVEEFKNKRISHFATITFKRTYEEECEYYQKRMQTKYEERFGDRIIPFSKNGETLSAIIERANMKLPPFSDAKDASDKGFKDCLLWLSILSYFKDNGEDEVLFITDDNAFRSRIEALQEEFRKETGKTIEICPNSHYKELRVSPKESISVPETGSEEVPNLDILREKIESTVDALRGIWGEDYYGNPEWSQTFTTSILFDKEYIRDIFASLQASIGNHLLERSIPASDVLDLDGRISDGTVEIPIQNLEDALKLYKQISKDLWAYSDQFFEATAKILNQNYRKPPASDTEDELPF